MWKKIDRKNKYVHIFEKVRKYFEIKSRSSISGTTFLSSELETDDTDRKANKNLLDKLQATETTRTAHQIKQRSLTKPSHVSSNHIFVFDHVHYISKRKSLVIRVSTSPNIELREFQ